MKSLIFILALFWSNIVFAEELVEFKPMQIEEHPVIDNLPVQSKWINISPFVSLSYFQSVETSPTVILVHGSGGVADRELHYAYRLYKLGFNTVIIDSFRPRGITNLLNSHRPALLPPQRADHDIPTVIDWVKKQPWHNGKIGLLGWSHGGTTILEAAPRFKYQDVAGAVVFYPQASRWHSKTSVPIEIHHGTADDWTYYSSSLNLTKPGLFHTPNALIKLWSYEGAHHGFDHQGWHYKLLGWNDDGYKLRTVAPHPEAELAKKRTEEFFKRILNDAN